MYVVRLISYNALLFHTRRRVRDVSTSIASATITLLLPRLSRLFSGKQQPKEFNALLPLHCIGRLQQLSQNALLQRQNAVDFEVTLFFFVIFLNQRAKLTLAFSLAHTQLCC